MAGELFDYDPLTGTTELFHWNETDGTFTIETIQDISDLREVNTANLNATEKHTPWGDGQMVASIPLNVWYDWKRQGIGDREDKANGYPKLKRALNDRDNRVFRTREGTL